MINNKGARCMSACCVYLIALPDPTPSTLRLRDQPALLSPKYASEPASNSIYIQVDSVNQSGRSAAVQVLMCVCVCVGRAEGGWGCPDLWGCSQCSKTECTMPQRSPLGHLPRCSHKAWTATTAAAAAAAAAGCGTPTDPALEESPQACQDC